MNYKKDFPIFRHQKELVYLDSAATAQKPQVVLDAIMNVYQNFNSNIHRGPHFLGEQTTMAYNDARRTIADFIQARYRPEIIFTRNATESINLVARSYGHNFLKRGDEVILSKMEHHSNIVPWLQLKKHKGIVIKYFDVSKAGRLIFDAKLFTPKTKLVAITAMSNVLGTVNDLNQIIKKAHDIGAKVLVDACQYVVHYPLNVQELDADFVAFSGHKIFGPTGIGILYAKETLLNAMPPFMGGGAMVRNVSTENFTAAGIPNKFEGGTPNIAGAIGLKAAIEYVQQIGYDTIQKVENELMEYLFEHLKKLPFVRIIGPQNLKNRGPVVSFIMKDIHPHDIAEGLSSKKICIRAGHHCSQILMQHYEIPATARISLSIYNTKEEIDETIKVLEEIYKYFN